MHASDFGAVCLSPDESALVSRGVQNVARGYRVEFAGAAGHGSCPKCGVVSSRLHSRYERRVRDLPVQGQRVLLRVRSRKFFCDNRACERRIFCERFGGQIEPFARMTARLEETLMRLALLTSARTAALIASALAMPLSASTLLRCAHRFVPPPCSAQAISVDDFAWRRGRRYGTIIVDLLTRRPVELLEDRSVDTLKRFLDAHPEVHTIARDRDARYAEAIAWAAPNATVVVDRWHLLCNLSDAFQRLVAARSGAWRHALQTHSDRQHAATVDARNPDDDGAADQALSSNSPRQHDRSAVHHERRAFNFRQAHALHHNGHTISAIAAQLGLDRSTIADYLTRDTPPDYSRRQGAPSNLDPHHDHLREAPIVTLPAARTLAWNLLQDRTDPTTRALLQHVPDALHHTNLARAGLDAIRHHDLTAWNAWHDAILAQPNSQLRRFALGLERDRDAITNALTLTYSNGPTEGNVNRLKLIKRTMYGRASFKLLRNKVLYHPT